LYYNNIVLNLGRVRGFIKRNSLKSVDAGDNVSSIISKSSGGHEPVLVYSKKKYLGIVWPHHLLYETKPRLSDKVGPLAVKTPHITFQDDVSKAIEAMIALRVYYLPVFSGSKIIGIITARSILRSIIRNKTLKDVIKKIEIRPPLVAEEHTKVRKIFSQMRKENQSRILLVDKQNHLTGIVSRWDIYLKLLAPPRGKQRYAAPEGHNVSEFDQDWPTKMDYPLTEIAHRRVITSSEKYTMYENLKKLLTDKVQSLVIVDNFNHPKAVISYRSVLKALKAKGEEREYPIVLTDRKRVLDAFHKDEVYDLLSETYDKWESRHKLSRIDAVLDAKKNAKDKPTFYTLTLRVRANSDLVNSRTEGEELRDIIHEGLEKINKQLERGK